MRINSIQTSFKANIEPLKASTVANTVTNPLQKTNDSNGNLAVYNDHNVKTPLKYSSLGQENLPCDIKANLYKLENGQRVVIIPKKGPTIVKTYVNVGSMNEPDKVRGISHFIEHNLFNGSEGLEAGQFFATVNDLGASTNASTSFAATDYYIQSNLLKKNDLETKIKIHASMLETPKFAKEMLEKEKGPVTSEINMILDDPENIATNNTLKLLYNIKSTSKDIIGGTVENINKLTQNDVVDYYKRNYYPANMVTVITGEVEPEKTMQLISKYFHSTNTNPKPREFEQLTPITKTVRNDFISNKTKAAIVSLGFNGPKNNDTKDKIMLDAFQFFLVGSSVARLNKSLEKIQSNAYLSSDRISTKPQDGMVVLFSTQTSDENVENAIKLVFNEIAKLEKNPPTDEELNIVKKKLKLNLAQVFESSSTINSVVGVSMLDNDLKSVKEFESVIDNMTSKDIVNFAKNYFNLNRVAITVVHPETADLQSIKKNYERANHISFTGNKADINHKTAIDESKIKTYVAKNNFAIVTNETDKELATFDMSLATEAPANVKPGTSHLLSIMLNRGSKFQSEKIFFSNLENQGIQTNFDANRREISVSSMFLPSDSKNAIKAAKEVILNPRLTEEDLKYAKNLLKENLQNVQPNSQEGMINEMFKGQFYGMTTKDILKDLDNIDLKEVQSLYNYILANAQGKMVISAPFEKKPELKTEIFNEISSDFNTLKPYKPSLFDGYLPIESEKVVIQEHSKSQAEIEMGYKFKTNDNLKDAVSFDLLNLILGGTPSSRLFSDLREQQKLAYQVKSSINTLDNAGVISLYIKTTTDDGQQGKETFSNLQKSIDGFKKHVNKIKNENVTEDELENAKLTLKNRILNASELTEDKNLSLMEGLKSFYGPALDNKTIDMIDKITVKDIKDTANYIFGTKPVISVVATKDTIDYNSEYLKKQGKVVSIQ